MRITSFSNSAVRDRVERLNAGLTSLLGSTLSRPTSDVTSDRHTLKFQTNGLFAGARSSLLNSAATAADTISESGLTLGKVRAQLETILSVAGKAANNRSAVAQEQAQLSIDRAVAELNGLPGNGRRQTSSATPGSRAELVLRGGSGSTVEDDATLQIAGGLGEALISVAQGESLADLSTRVNQLAALTGVTAFADNGNLVFQSVDIGSESTISVQAVANGPTVSGLNDGQLVDFVVNGIDLNSSDTISGSVTAGRAAELAYDGNAGSLIFDTGELAISGSRGTANITFYRGESLDGLASLVNLQAASTGVIATVSGGQLAFRSLETGSAANIAVGLNYNRLSVSGVDSSQVAAFDVLSLQPGATTNISGEITTAAAQAEQVYVGQNGRVTESATFELSGNQGNATVSFQRGERLTDVADRINQLTPTTGVTAAVGGSKLVFSSVDYGSAAGFSIEVTSLVSVTGLNDNQIAEFQVDAIAANANLAISGQVVDAAEQAQLKYRGGAGSVVKDDATFNVAGNLGTASFTVTNGESLSDVADRINAETETTGITANVVDNNLFFNSVAFGTNAQAFVEVSSGKFDVSGGASFNGGEISYGKDAQAEINGVDYSGDGNRFTFSDGAGSVTLEFADGFAGDFDAVSVISASTEDVVNVFGANNSQVTGFQVNSIDPGDYQDISGRVTAAAERAQLKYSGQDGSLVKDGATFNVAGSLGSASFTVIKDESLSDVADRINLQTAVTGVTAIVVDNDLFLNSVEYGAEAQAFVEVTSGKFDVSGGAGFNGGEISYGEDVQAKINGVDYSGDGNQLLYSQGSGSFTIDFAAGFEGTFDSIAVASTVGADNLTDGENASPAGVNSDQFASFQVDEAIPDSVQTVSGSVVDAATQAQLKYRGDAGSVVKDNANFNVTGSLGTASFTVTAGESLSDVANRINAETGATGVTATVVDNNLFLNSVDYGTDAQAYVKVTSGKFEVDGGDSFKGGEISYGTDVKAEINGVDFVGSGNQLSFNDATGSFTVEFEAGFVGDFNPVSVASFNTAFGLGGGNGDGTANGVDAQAVINGNNLTANVNRFSFSDASGSYTLDGAVGFTGTIDTITVASIETAYAIDGGNGDGTARGQDAEAVINGQTLTSVGNRFTYESNQGNYVLEFAAGFSGSFDEIRVSSTASARFDITGGNGAGTAEGTDPGVTFVVGQHDLAATVSVLVFEPPGRLASIALGVDAASLGNLQQFASGGTKSGLELHAADAIRATQQALAYVSNIESILERAANRGSASISRFAGIGTDRDANLAARSVRSIAGQADLNLLDRSYLDPRRVLNLLRATAT